MEQLTQNVDTLFSNMETFSQKEGLIGKPVTQGDKTFLPIVSVTVGYGGGDTQNKGQGTTPTSSTSTGTSGSMTGAALGVGAKLSTDAVIVIDKDAVSILPLTQQGNVSQMINKIPEIITNIKPSS